MTVERNTTPAALLDTALNAEERALAHAEALPADTTLAELQAPAQRSMISTAD